jgi:hypothetical protein
MAMRIYSTESYPGRTVAVTVEWRGLRVRVERIDAPDAPGWRAGANLPDDMCDAFWHAWNTDSEVHGVPVGDIYPPR